MTSQNSDVSNPISREKSLVRTEFQEIVDALRHAYPHIHQDIDKGIHPFKVFREHFGILKDDVANAMDLSIFDYIEMENGEISPDEDDILKFCRYMEIHPYDLTSDGVFDLPMIKALLKVYDQPYLLSMPSDRAKDISMHALIAEAYQGYRDLSQNLKGFRKTYPYTQALTIGFLDAVLNLDGKLSLEPLDIFDQAYEHVQMAEDDHYNLTLKFARVSNEWNAYSKKYNLFGLYLYRDDRSWISQKLFKHANKKSVDETFETYMKDPSFIGLKHWPELSAPLFIDGKAYSWRQAQKRHAYYFLHTFLASAEKNSLKSRRDSISQQHDLMKSWIPNSYDRLARFENRQVILKHPDFQYLKKTVNRSVVPYTPQITGLWALHQKTL